MRNTLEKLIDECNIRKLVVDKLPNDLYLQFRYYVALQELSSYNATYTK